MSANTIAYLTTANAANAANAMAIPSRAADLVAFFEGKKPHDLKGLLDDGLVRLTEGQPVLTSVGERAVRYIKLSS